MYPTTCSRIFRLALCPLLLLAACDLVRPGWRTYEEVSKRPPAPPASPAMRDIPAPPPAAAIAWQAPAHWRDTGPAGMRLASFSVGTGSDTGLCTIIRMGAAAGDLVANTRRWMTQVGIPEPTPAEMAAFLERQARLQTAGGWPATVVDLTSWGTPALEHPSMLAALASPGDLTLFIKLTGPVSLLRAEQSAFVALVRSLRREDP